MASRRSSEASAVFRSATLTAAVIEAHGRGDWAGLRALYRTCAYSSAATARAVYVEHGVDLGIRAYVLPLLPDDAALVAFEP